MEEDLEYVVSPTGHYVVELHRGTDSGGGGVYRLFVIETTKTTDRVALGDEYERSIEVIFSPDEEWIVLNHYPATGVCTPLLFHHRSEAKFENIPSLDVDAQVRQLYVKDTGDKQGTSPDVSIFLKVLEWKPDSSGFTLYIASGDLQFDGWEAFYNVMDGRPMTTGVRQRSQADWEILEALTEQNRKRDLEQQLNTIYQLLKAKLNRDDQAQLVAQQRQWLADREEMMAGREQTEPGDREAFTRDRIAQLTKLVLK
jgi:uncharacterized protein YecT (DUF1311 family)